MKTPRNQHRKHDTAFIRRVAPGGALPPLPRPARIPSVEVSWERLMRSAEKAHERMRRCLTALDAAAIPCTVAGGHAVAAWVSRVDAAAARHTPDVEVVLRRADLPAAIAALIQAGFSHKRTGGIEMFLDGPKAGVRDAVRIVFAAEKVRPRDTLPAPEVSESEPTSSFRLLTLLALVRMKLTSFRDEDRTHLRDLIEVGWIDGSWCSKLPVELGARLRQLLDDPEG